MQGASPPFFLQDTGFDGDSAGVLRTADTDGKFASRKSSLLFSFRRISFLLSALKLFLYKVKRVLDLSSICL